MEREEKFAVKVHGVEYDVTVIPSEHPERDELDFKIVMPQGEIIIYPSNSPEKDPEWKSDSDTDPRLVQEIGEAIEDYYE